MSIEIAIKIISKFNEWRTGGQFPMLNPKLVTLAIDEVIKHYENTTKKI